MTSARRAPGAAAGLAAAALLTACGAQPQEAAPATTTGCMVSAPAGFADRSIGQLSFGELSHAQSAGFLASTSSQRVSTLAGTEEALGRYAGGDCSLGALVGPGGAEALAAVAARAPDTAWLAVATGGTDYPDNVVTIDFDLREPAFIAGYAAAASSETGTVAMFVSRGFAGGEELLAAFDAGVEQRGIDTGSEVAGLREGSVSRRTVDDTPAAGREYTEAALEAGADVIVPFASGAASGVLDVFAEHYAPSDEAAADGAEGTDGTAGPSTAAAGVGGPEIGEGDGGSDEDPEETIDPTLIWYGTDGARTLDDGLGEHVIASTVPNVAAGFQSTVAGWPETGFAGEIEEPAGEERTIGEIGVRTPEYTGTMDNGGVEVVASDGLLSTVAGLSRDIAEVRDRIRAGEIDVPGAD
ncbi:basic membrane protein A and related proteins [Brevibacterium pityocampae]